MKKIVIIGCYFGQLREDVRFFIQSIRNNPTIDWVIITDCEWPKVPNNIRIERMSFETFKLLVQKSFDFKICLDAPYKICDFKPAFGHIFSDYIAEYDFWGHCDFDMLFGNLRTFLTDDKLDSYDRIYYQGHLSLYRNVPQINDLYKSDKGNISYLDAFSNKGSFVFDEVDGMYYICKNEKIRFYKEVEYADIFPYINLWLHPRKEYSISKRFPVNKKYQVFGYKDGRIIKWSKDAKNAMVVEEEYAYIHFSHKVLMSKCDSFDFYITRKGLIRMDEGKIPFERYYRGFDELKMNTAELVYRTMRKIKKLKNK